MISPKALPGSFHLALDCVTAGPSQGITLVKDIEPESPAEADSVISIADRLLEVRSSLAAQDCLRSDLLRESRRRRELPRRNLSLRIIRGRPCGSSRRSRPRSCRARDSGRAHP